MSNPDISVVILCFQAGNKIYKFLNDVIKNLDLLTSNWEIVLVGNYVEGALDETPRIVKEIAATNHKIKSVAIKKNGWMGWDARKGLELCTGEIIAIIDGDEQMVAEDITRAYHQLKQSNADIVKSFRKKRYDPWIRRANSYIYNIIFNMLFPGYPIRDVHSKPKMFCRQIYEQLQLTANDWFFDAEIMIQARRHKWKLLEFPTTFYRAPYRKSFVRLSAVFEFAKNLFIARIREFFIRNLK